MIGKIIKKYHSSGLVGVCRALMWRLFRPRPVVHPVNLALCRVAEKSGFAVVQLGAFTGDTLNDPLFCTLKERLPKVSGTLLLVEPVACHFEKLVKNYEGIPGVIFENVAVADFSGEAEIYRLGVDPADHGYPDWLAQLSSLKEERMGALWDRYEQNAQFKEFFLEHRVKEKVQCMTFEELVSRHKIRAIDLLQIDVEGCELEILRTIDFRKTPIRFVNFESVLLQDLKNEADRLMIDNGFQLLDYDQDTFCYTRRDRNLAKRYNHR